MCINHEQSSYLFDGYNKRGLLHDNKDGESDLFLSTNDFSNGDYLSIY